MHNESDQEPNPALLYANLAGALLLVLGMSGFFYSSSFGTPGGVHTAFGLFAVNGWRNVVLIATGAVALVAARPPGRLLAAALGVFYVAIAVWGLILGSGGSILSVLPVNGADNVLALVVGLLGLIAAAATPGADRSRRSRPRERPAGTRGGERAAQR